MNGQQMFDEAERQAKSIKLTQVLRDAIGEGKFEETQFLTDVFKGAPEGLFLNSLQVALHLHLQVKLYKEETQKLSNDLNKSMQGFGFDEKVHIKVDLDIVSNYRKLLPLIDFNAIYNKNPAIINTAVELCYDQKMADIATIIEAEAIDQLKRSKKNLPSKIGRTVL